MENHYCSCKHKRLQVKTKEQEGAAGQDLGGVRGFLLARIRRPGRVRRQVHIGAQRLHPSAVSVLPLRSLLGGCANNNNNNNNNNNDNDNKNNQNNQNKNKNYNYNNNNNKNICQQLFSSPPKQVSLKSSAES